MWIKTLKEAAVVMLIALILAGASYTLRSLYLPPAAVQQGSGQGDDAQAAIAAISLEAAQAHFKQGTALFADARPQKAFQKGHIKGAMNLDPNTFDDWSGDFFSRISPEQVVIAYCEGERCTLSLELAEKLTWLGYEKVYYLKNGWGLWKDQQLPVE